MPLNSKQQKDCAYLALAGTLRVTGLARALGGILLLALFHDPSQALSAALPSSYNVTLTWDSSPSPEVVGYRLYYGTVSGDYVSSIVTGNVTTVIVPGLLIGITYYFAATAVDAKGLESDFSNEVSYRKQTLAVTMTQPHGTFDELGQFILTITGPPGHTYDIEASEDLSVWTVIGAVTFEISGSLDFTDTNAANFPKRFYRVRDNRP